MISPEGKIMGRYNKIHLVPFAEYIPYKDLFPWPSRFISKASNFIAGTEYTIFNLDGAKFGTLICWESVYPELVRQFIKNGANFMVNITNEVLLGDTAAPYQIAAIGVFRAVENRISVVRCANNGISCFIDPIGKIIGRVHDSNNKDIFVEGYLTEEIPLSQRRTFYTMFGDVFVYMNLFMAVFLIGLSFVKGKALGTKAQSP
jgi:apolipoprotein N-acyltransferase